MILGLVGLCGMPRASEGATKVACVGDSITQSSGWCEALGTKLGTTHTVNNFGVSGTTLMKSGDSPYWECDKFAPSHEFAPDIVVIMLGTNDSKPQNWSHRSEFVADYEALIASYTALSSDPQIYACLPPGAGTNSYSISGTVIESEVIPLIRQAASNQSIPVIDIYTAFGGDRLDTSLFGSTNDQVHPNAKGAQVISDTVYKALTTNAGSAGAGSSGAGGTQASSSSSTTRSGAGGVMASASIVGSGGTAISGIASRPAGTFGGSHEPTNGGTRASSETRATSIGGTKSNLIASTTGGTHSSPAPTSSTNAKHTGRGGTQSSAGGARSTLSSSTVSEVSSQSAEADACSCRVTNRNHRERTQGWLALLSLVVVLGRRRNRIALR